MENRVINLGVVAEVAEALKIFKDQVVFVGGAVISLYTDDPAADEIRPTGDIDMTLKVLNLGRWSEIQKEQRNKEQGTRNKNMEVSHTPILTYNSKLPIFTNHYSLESNHSLAIA